MEVILYAERMDYDTWKPDKSYDGMTVQEAKTKLERFGYEPYGKQMDNEFRYWKPFTRNKIQIRLFTHCVD